MKTTFLIILFIAISMSGKAQEAKTQWATLKIPQLKCWECQDRLEKYLVREKGPAGDAGILRWNIYLTSATMRIQYIPSRINLEYIKTAVANAGFDVDEIKATEDSYKLLPPACKRAEEGGGPKKGKPCHLPPLEIVI